MSPTRTVTMIAALAALGVGTGVLLWGGIGSSPDTPVGSGLGPSPDSSSSHPSPGLAPPFADHGTVPMPAQGADLSDAGADARADWDEAEFERLREGDGVRPIPLPLDSPIPMTRGTWPNVRVDSAVYAPEETAITIDPDDPNRIVAGAQGSGCYSFFSDDAGLTWSEYSLPDPYDLGDSSLASDEGGWAYYAYIGTFSHSGIYVARSTDSGETWAEGVPVLDHNSGQPFEDKEYPVVDRTGGPYDGSVYIGWTQFDRYGSSNSADSTRILFSYSRDHAASFSTAVRVSDEGGNCVDEDDTVEGAVPAVGPDGTIYMAWAGPRGLEFDLSTDGGDTWGDDVVLSDIPGGWDFAVPGIYRCNGLPQTVADYTSSPYSGRIYVLWSDQRNGDTDVFLLRSDDGVNWMPIKRVNGDTVGNGRHQFFPWMALDPLTGHLHIVFYDRRDTSGNDTEVWLASSIDGGDTFTEQVVSQSPFNPFSSVFFGDYIGIAAYGGRVRPYWMRLDGNQMSSWTALVDLDTTSVPPPASPYQFAVYPNPVRDQATIFAWSTNVNSGLPAGDAQIYSADGRLVRSLAPLPGTGARTSTAAQRSPEAQVSGPCFAPGGSWPFATWDLKNETGRSVPSGSYWVKGPEGGSTRIVVTR
ncbi:MAG: exo-alpha-sialidase [Candidatus Eisenbacteria bacterium]|uniref:Exo-alpha-sialidase n=1 Tax=Eiseniibacteriota bacterium TaxID=2212470 RepID=A0A956NE92_UNCEI|nr:exo-alpha-sialidase [Candidatus Eisenbacteria bacterium]MCB9463561.1 exo-alpha-sialidase [Candidatus Eisenbacteria bacterium]